MPDEPEKTSDEKISESILDQNYEINILGNLDPARSLFGEFDMSNSPLTAIGHGIRKQSSLKQSLFFLTRFPMCRLVKPFVPIYIQPHRILLLLAIRKLGRP